MQALPTPTVALNAEAEVLASNPAAQALFGAPIDLATIVRTMVADGECTDRDVTLLAADGTERFLLLTVAPLDLSSDAPGGRPDHVDPERADGDGWLVTAMDVTRLRRAEHDRDRLTTVDAVTGLPNRRQLDIQLGLALERHRRHPGRLAAFAIRFDELDELVRVHGREVVDQIVVEAAARLHLALRSGDFAARTSADGFVVLVEREQRQTHDAPRRARRAGADDLSIVSRRLAKALGEPVELDGVTVAIEVSVGVAVATDEDDVERFVTRAEAELTRVVRPDGRRPHLQVAR